MASVSDIEEVRRNTAETSSSSSFTDAVLGAYIDDLGVAGAAAKVWEEKAASYVELVDTTEAGASHKFSDLLKNAQSQATYWGAKAVVAVDVSGRPKVRKIVRS